MKYKVLFVSTAAITSMFNLSFMRWFRKQGWQVDYVSDGEVQIPDCDNQYAMSIKRSPYNYKNITAYKELRKLLVNDYDIIHCHTPIASVLTRLAAKNICTKAKVIYTSHGFHFYKGAPLANWLIYYPIEKYFSKYTDTLITINKEDYAIARKKFSLCKSIYMVNGMGVDLSKFYPRTSYERKRLRVELGYNENDYIITNIAEITENKNQIMLIEALPLLKNLIPNLKVLFIGSANYSGFLRKVRKTIAKLRVQDFTYFLGFREDIDNFTAISNLAFSASVREGLGLNIAEAMACGIPIVCSRNRGHNSLIIDGKSGLLFSNAGEMTKNILRIYNSKSLSAELCKNAIEDVKKFDRNLIIKEMAKIYSSSLNGILESGHEKW